MACTKIFNALIDYGYNMFTAEVEFLLKGVVYDFNIGTLLSLCVD